MLPAVPPASGTALPLCSAINQVAIPSLDMGLATGLLDGTGNPLNGTGLPSGCWPNYGPQPGIPSAQTMWYAEGGTSGAPDPRNAGPAWIQIGSEGGLLPAPVVIPPTPINYELNTRSVTVTNVAVHGLWLGPAERADVIVDFSQFANKTLILYNDAPTPAPGFDSRLDYFTGDGDQSPIGGAPDTPPGYGPNTRTIMQVVVDQTVPNTVPFSLSTLKSAFASTTTTRGLFASTQPTAIVPEAAYNSAYAKTFPNVYASIQANTLTFSPIQPLTFESLLSGEPSVCTGTTTPPAQCASLNQKTIQELFTLDYGRMNATLGTELPLTNFQTQTTLPLGYVDPPTEVVRQGDTQLWKITHNGVDTHFIHFHLFNVQVVNRMGWDGTIRPPDANEMGWKDTVRMNPLEDILVALQPITPQLPWPIPNSIRLEDPARSQGYTGAGFSNIDPFTGGGAATTNDPTNFGWEYVWHCHILGHEENNMMRPIVFQVPPAAPSNLTAVENTSGQTLAVTLTFTDNSASETGFTIQRDTLDTFTSTDLISIPVGPSTPTNVAGEGTSWGGTITVADSNGLVGSKTYFYRVQAVDDGFKAPPGLEQSYNATNAMVSAWSGVASVVTQPIPPTVSFTGAPATAAYNTTFTVTATTNASTLPTISGTAGVCMVGPVSGTAANATAQVTIITGSSAPACTIMASWAADPFFQSATATQITTPTLATPTVSFTGTPASAVYLSTFTVTATTNASMTPTISGTAGICTVSPMTGSASNAQATVTMNTGTGSCVLTANWIADTNYSSAGPLTQTTTATKKAPTVGLAGAPASAVYNTSFIVAATTNASDATTYPSITGTPGICTVGTIGGTFVSATATVTMISGTGTCTVAANWAATANYGAAGPATQSTTAAKAVSATSILAHTPNPSVVGQAVPVTFSVTGTGVAPTGNVTVKATTGESCTGTVAAGTCSLIFVTTGTRTMTATYAGDANFNGSSSAASTSQNVLDFVLGIKPGTQTVNGGQRAAYTLTATAIGGVAMPITLSCAINQPAYTCTVTPTSVTPNGGTKNATVYVNTVKNHAGTWTLTVTGVDTQTGFTLTHTVTGQLSVKN
jgi:FtsP/CotA-like multicopper oxidase with cupredoxin domain